MEIVRSGEQAVVLSLPGDRTRECVAAVKHLYHFLNHHRHPAIVSVRPGFDCVLIEHSSDPGFEDWLLQLKATYPLETKPSDHRQERLTIPVCYDYGTDLFVVSEKTRLDRAEIIDLHSDQEYEVWMIGFMPGFPYLGELPPGLQIPRKKNPDPFIAAGSVAIAEEFVGIYPFDSPGGWHVIGRTPLKIIDYSRDIPWTFDYEMKVRFQPISSAEFERMFQR